MPGPLAHQWTLDPAVTFLNHGSFGACPRRVLEAQAELRARLERQPVHFFVREYGELLDGARAELASFLGADPEGLGFVANATTGVNAVLRSLDFQAGDELLVTDHEYNACRNALDFVASRAGARVVVVTLPFPLTHEDEILEALLSRVTDRTRIALVDHITSATGMVLPIQRIVDEMGVRGVETLVDGAHAPGMVELELEALGAAWYSGNCHKWICAPKGAGFLSVREDLREATRPTVISHGANIPPTERTRFRHEFDWVGTQDPTAWLCVPEALRCMEGLVPGGWPEIRRRNRDLTLEARRLLADALQVPLPCPDEMIGSLATVFLPDGPPGEASALYVDPLQQRLWDKHRIEVPISPFPAPPKRLIRISAQLYNIREDYHKLAAALV